MSDSQRCSHVKPDGSSCRIAVGLLPSTDGQLLCPWHDPARAAKRRQNAEGRAAPAAPLFPELVDLPVQSVDSLADAEALARWAMIQVTTGGLSPRAYQALVSGIKEYRMVLADSGILERTRKLMAQLERDAAEFADLRRRVAVAKEKGLDV